MVYWDVGDGVVRCGRPGMSRGGRAGTLVALAGPHWQLACGTDHHWTGQAGWVAPRAVRAVVGCV